jgi:C4-dicarboxylate-specific signal transduction histidine kinase
MSQPNLYEPDVDLPKPINAPNHERLIEAARYALLRRLAPALRHDLAGSLQPISMIATILERRLQMAQPDLELLAKNASVISNLSREAVSSCMSLMTWLAPQGQSSQPINTGVDDVLKLLVTDFSFRGFTLENDCGDAQGHVLRSVLRSVFVAALLALSDTAQAPALIRIGVQTSDEGLTLLLTLTDQAGEPPPALDFAYRLIGWDDVQALAISERVQFSRDEKAVAIRFGY